MPEHARRVALPVVVAVCIIALLAIFSPQALELVLLKTLSICIGFAIAHAIRKLAFPYIDFSTSTDREHKLLVVGLYLVCIWAFAIGG